MPRSHVAHHEYVNGIPFTAKILYFFPLKIVLFTPFLQVQHQSGGEQKYCGRMPHGCEHRLNFPEERLIVNSANQI